jgi:hypothetical protein
MLLWREAAPNSEATSSHIPVQVALIYNRDSLREMAQGGIQGGDDGVESHMAMVVISLPPYDPMARHLRPNIQRLLGVWPHCSAPY